MRFYDLKLNGMSLAKLDEKNPGAIRLTFQLQVTSGAEVPNAMVTLYNVDRSFFGDTTKFFNNKVELFAGIKNTPLTARQGIIPPSQNLILSGYLDNVIPNANEPDGGNSFTLMIQGSPRSPNTENGVLMEINSGDSLKDKIKTAINSLYPLANVKVEGIPSLATQKEKMIFENIKAIKDYAFKRDIALFTTKDGYLITDDKALSNVIVLKSTDFLEQPSQQNVDLYRFSLQLRADIDINTTISIPSNLLLTNDISLNFLGQGTAKTYIQGMFKVVSIWHIGDSRNISADSWATNIEAVRV